MSTDPKASGSSQPEVFVDRKELTQEVREKFKARGTLGRISSGADELTEKPEANS